MCMRHFLLSKYSYIWNLSFRTSHRHARHRLPIRSKALLRSQSWGLNNLSHKTQGLDLHASGVYPEDVLSGRRTFCMASSLSSGMLGNKMFSSTVTLAVPSPYLFPTAL